jgi:hypothetical protein
LGATEKQQQSKKNGFPWIAATIIDGMKAHTVGRTLGIGLRIAGRIAGQRAAAAAQNASSPAADRQAAEQRQATGQVAGRVSGGVVRGIGGFLRPFRRVGGKLMLEVTGVFFFLPVVVFGPALWRARASYSHGPDHWTFLLSAAISALFLYLSVSSFWRAWRK